MEVNSQLLDLGEIAWIWRGGCIIRPAFLNDTVTAGIAAPAYAASLSYFDAFRSQRMPANLIQAQRDLFGAHTYELIGKTGAFRTQWYWKKNATIA